MIPAHALFVVDGTAGEDAMGRGRVVVVGVQDSAAGREALRRAAARAARARGVLHVVAAYEPGHAPRSRGPRAGAPAGRTDPRATAQQQADRACVMVAGLGVATRGHVGQGALGPVLRRVARAQGAGLIVATGAVARALRWRAPCDVLDAARDGPVNPAFGPRPRLGHDTVGVVAVDDRGPAPDLAAGPLLALGTGALALGVVKAPAWGWTAPATLASWGAGLALLMWLWHRSAAYTAPDLERRLLRLRSLARGAAATRGRRADHADRGLSAGFPRREEVLNGRPVAYRIAGQGPVIVLLHGVFDCAQTWQRVVEPLSRHFTVLVPDLPGDGTCPAGREADHSLAAHNALLRALLDRLGHERVTLVGHSLAGGLAMTFADRHPERTERLVLVSSGGLGREVHRALRLATVPGAGLALAALASRPGRGLLRAGAVLTRRGSATTSRTLDELALTLGGIRGRPARRAAVATLRAVVDGGGQRVDALGRLAELGDIPLLVVWGAQDRTIPVAHGAAGHRVHARSRMLVLDGAGHHPHISRPAAVADTIAAFAADRPARPVRLIPGRA